MYVLNSVAPYIRGWHTFEQLLTTFAPFEFEVIFRKNKKSRSEIEKMITSQKSMLVKSCYFYQL